MRPLAFLFLTAGLLGACANVSQMRTVADKTASEIGAHRTTTADFLARQTQANAYDANRLLDLSEQAAATSDEVHAITDGWSADDARQAELARLTGASAQAIIDALETPAPAPASLGDGGAGAALGKAQTQFAALAKKPTALQQWLEVYELAGSLDAAYEGLKTTAAADAAKPAPKPAAAAAK